MEPGYEQWGGNNLDDGAAPMAMEEDLEESVNPRDEEEQWGEEERSSKEMSINRWKKFWDTEKNNKHRQRELLKAHLSLGQFVVPNCIEIEPEFRQKKCINDIKRQEGEKAKKINLDSNNTAGHRYWMMLCDVWLWTDIYS